jgi:thiol-disulfide isomerase/thioredoxin
MMRPMRTPLLACLVALAVACAGPRAARSSSLVGKSVDVTARDLDGHDVKVSRNGATVAVVDFWATWCEPCRDQLRMLGELATELQPLGVEVYAVSFDEDRAAVEEFLARTPVSFPVLWDKGGASLAERLEVTRLPTTLVFDRAGVVRAVHLGFDPGERAELAREVRQLALK